MWVCFFAVCFQLLRTIVARRLIKPIPLATPMGGGEDADHTLEKSALFDKSALPILIVSAILTIVLGTQLFPLPVFDTDLSAFTPETPAEEAQNRMSDEFPAESRPMFIHITTDDGGNVLTMENLHLQQEALDEVMNRSSSSNDYVESIIAAPMIIQHAIDESDANGTLIEDYENWPSLLDEIFDEDTMCDMESTQDLDERALAAAAFIQESLIHQDLDFDATCTYLEDNTGDAIPSASSTLWVIMIDPDLDDTERQVQQDFIRSQLNQFSEDTDLNFHSTSLDLMSHDINKNTVGELTILVIGALVIVVTLLAIAFRSVRGVVFPLVGLSAALVWTYGGMALAGVEFSILEVAVAPVVLGLGIDYSIHLQRRYNTFRAEGDSASMAWLKGFETLKVALSIAVITTMAAFLANMVSPLPPLRDFGMGLAFGVFCAFASSTLLVGSLHVVMERDSSAYAKHIEWMRFGNFGQYMIGFQKLHQAKVIGVVALMTIGSVIFAAAKLETEFDLTDFLDEDMDVMQGRDSLYESYGAAGWKPIYILIEPDTGQTAISDDEPFLEAHRDLDGWLGNTQGVVAPETDGNSHPAYDGPYLILYEAVEADSDFALAYNLAIEKSRLEVYDGSTFTEGIISAALVNLSSNQTISDPLTGESWSERVQKVVSFNEDGSIQYIRMEVLIEVKTSSESSAVLAAVQYEVSKFSEHRGSEGTIVHVAGDSVSLEAVLDGLTESQLQSTLISLAVCFTVLLALTRRIGTALIIVLPVGIAATWVVGAMAILNLNWNVMTVMVTALTIGLGIDYSIHVWRRFEAMKAKEGDVWSGMREMYASTGVALLLSAGTTICGFTVLLLSQMPVVQDFGIVTAITVFFSLVLALILLPVFLVLDSQTKNGSGS